MNTNEHYKKRTHGGKNVRKALVLRRNARQASENQVMRRVAALKISICTAPRPRSQKFYHWYATSTFLAPKNALGPKSLRTTAIKQTLASPGAINL